MEKTHTYRRGKQSVYLPKTAYIHSSASVVGTKEGEGCFKEYYDRVDIKSSTVPFIDKKELELNSSIKPTDVNNNPLINSKKQEQVHNEIRKLLNQYYSINPKKEINAMTFIRKEIIQQEPNHTIFQIIAQLFHIDIRY